MRQIDRNFVTLVLALCCVAQLGAFPARATVPAAAPEPPDEIVVTGRVVDEAGRPVQGALVDLTPHPDFRLGRLRLSFRLSGVELDDVPGLPDAIPTDEAGRFVLGVPPTLVHRLRRTCNFGVRISHPDAISVVASLAALTDTGRCDRSETESEGSLRRLDLPVARLAASEPVEVRVLDPAGDPAAGAWVQIHAAPDGADPDGPWRLLHPPVRCDDRGSARVRRPAGVAASASAFRHGTSPAATTLDSAGSAAAPRTVRLGEAAAQTLWILGPDGRPAAQAQVLLPPGNWPAGAAGSRGLVTIHRPLGETPVTILAGDSRRFEHRLARRTFRGDERILVDLGAPRPALDLDAGPSVFGRVVSESGDPVAGAVVQLLDPRTRTLVDDGRGLALSADDGSFQLTIPEFQDRFGLRGQDVVARLDVSALGYVDRSMTDVTANVERGGGQLGPPLEIVLRPDLRIAGTVRNESGEPIGGAMVYLAGEVPGSRGAHVVTAADGRFSFEGVEQSTAGVSLVLLHLDYVARTVPLSTLPEQPLGLELVLEDAVKLRGRVVDSEGRAVEGAGIQRVHEEERHEWIDLVFGQAMSDADGAFEFFGLAPEVHRLAIDKTGFRRLVRDVDVRPGSEERAETFELEASPSHVVSGRIVGDVADGVAGLRVVLTSHRGSATQWHSRLADTADEDGAFRIEDVPPGRYQPAVGRPESRRDFPVRRQVVEVEGPTEIEIEILPTATVSGRIYGLTRSELEEVHLSPWGEVEPGSASFRIVGLEPGQHLLTATLKDASRWSTVRVDVERGGGESTADFDFDAVARLAGVVRLGGEPLAGASLYLQPGLARLSEGTTGADGIFAFDGLPYGRYRLRVRHPARPERGRRSRVLHTRTVELDDDLSIAIDLEAEETWRLTGRVVDAESDEPLADVQISMRRIDAAGDSTHVPDGLSDRDGSFRFEELRSGTWRLLLEKRGFGGVARTVIVEDDDLDLGNLEMEPTDGLQLRMTGPRGRWPDTAWVRLLDPRGVVLASGSLIAGPEGWMRLVSAPEGRWRVWVLGGGLVGRGEVEIPGPPTELSGELGASLRVELGALQAEEASGRLELLDTRGRPVFEARSFDGSSEMKDLPAGQYTVRVTWDDEVWTSQVDLLAGSFEALRLSEPSR